MIGLIPITDPEIIKVGMVLRLMSKDNSGPVSQSYSQAFSDCLVVETDKDCIYTVRPYAGVIEFGQDKELKIHNKIEQVAIYKSEHYLSQFMIVVDASSGKPISCLY